MSASNPTVTLDRLDDYVAIVTLNRPEAMNAIDRETALALGAAVDAVESDPKLRAAVITGAGGRAFCAGADLKLAAAGHMSTLFIEGRGFAGFVDAPRRKPWIAAVDGFALGGGCEIALACDMIVASSVSQFGLPEVRRGVIAAAGGAYRIARTIPRNVAAEILLTGRTFDAAEGQSFGFVNRITAPGEALSVGASLAQQVAANSPLAVEATLTLVRGCFDESDGVLGELSRNLLEGLSISADYHEGLTAFVEKRDPIWIGR